MTDDPHTKPLHCSFCGKEQSQVKRLIAGPTVFICDECVWMCTDVILDDGIKPGGKYSGRLLEALESARGLLPFLYVSGDREHPNHQFRLDQGLTQAQQLRAEADHVEAKEAAIQRFRDAMKPFTP